MEIVKLGLAEMQALYEARMKEDFPPSELRPWSSMRTLTEQGSYLCFGFQAVSYTHLTLPTIA